MQSSLHSFITPRFFFLHCFRRLPPTAAPRCLESCSNFVRFRCRHRTVIPSLGPSGSTDRERFHQSRDARSVGAPPGETVLLTLKVWFGPICFFALDPIS